MRSLHLAVTAAVLAACMLFAGTASAAYQTNGVAVSDYATGFAAKPNGVGPIGIAVDRQNRVYVLDAADGFLYRFSGPGQATPAQRLGSAPISSQPGALAFDGSGRLYAARGEGSVVELDPNTGAVVRTVANNIQCPLGLSSDPVSGDLFASDRCSNRIVRIRNPASTDNDANFYGGVAGTVDGVTVAPDGTIFVATETVIRRVSGVTSPNPGQVSDVAPLNGGDGIVVSADQSGKARFLIVNGTDGRITRIDLEQSPAVVSELVTGGTRGDFLAVGADGCIYATQTDTVIKVTNVDGTCNTIAGGPLTGSTPPDDSGNPIGLPQGQGRRRCVDRRKFKFRLHHGPTTTVVRVDIFVNGKLRLRKRGKDINTVTLRRLPRKIFRVRVVSYHSNGARLISTRTYRGCKKSKPKVRRRGPKGERGGRRS